MTESDRKALLNAAYGAGKPGEIARVYDQWAETYDADMSAVGYRHPTICLALLARFLGKGEMPVLDAGAGTGLIGEWLKITGYPVIEALDISPGMLAVAARKAVYVKLHCAVLGAKLPLADGAYAGIVSAGVFTSGHVGAEGLDELIRICRRGGVIVLTVKDTLWLGGFGERVATLASVGAIGILEETPSYVSMPGEQGTVRSRALALRVKPAS